MNAAQASRSGNPGSLLHAKFMAPRPQVGALERRGLLSRLDDALAKKLILLCAPTGFGKTTLVSTWLSRGKFASAWLTLDRNDNDPIRFWTYLVSAVRNTEPSIGKSTLSALMSPQPPSPEAFLTPFLNDLARLTRPLILVLEDYHLITSNAVSASLWFLIQHVPEAFHLVIITRTAPDLPIAVLRARDQLLELDATSLRWNEDEASQFLRQSLGTEVPDEVVAKLLERTEGWPAGLRLLTLSMGPQASVEELAASLAGSGRYVADYLITEVFDAQPQDVQAFLLKTCFFGRLTGALCDHITGGHEGTVMLERLEHDNLFIVPLQSAGARPWYRYSALFAESLQHVARQRLNDAEVRDLFEKAGNWYEANGLYEEAIESALGARLFPRALALIEKYIGIHDISELLTLQRWLENVPAEAIQARPLVSFVYAQILLYTGDRYAPATPVQLEPLLHAAESAWQAEGDLAHLGQVHTIRGTVAWWQGDLSRAFEYAHQALAELPEQDVLYRGSSLLTASREALDAGRITAAQDMVLEARAQMGAAQNIHGVLAALQMLAEVAFWQGEWEQARQLNQQIHDEAIGGPEMLDDKGAASLGLADAAYEQNDLAQAEQLANRALELGLERDNEMLQAGATIRLARIRAARQEFATAMELLRSLSSSLTKPVFLRELQAEQARCSILTGETLSLTAWNAMIGETQQGVSATQQEHEAFILARLQMAEGKPAEALDTLKGRRGDAARNGRLRSEVEAGLLEALAYHAQAKRTEAAARLIPALKIGQAKDLLRIFLDEGPRMAALLEELASNLDDRSLSLYASTLLHWFGPGREQAGNAAGSAHTLSQQELRVLRLLAAGLSNADMAQELVVSTNTIKSHIKSIYRKLGIASRAEAREAARALRLL